MGVHRTGLSFAGVGDGVSHANKPARRSTPILVAGCTMTIDDWAVVSAWLLAWETPAISARQ
jgi:hypothetical protein